MANYKLSVLMPAIRPDRWYNLYKSLKASFSGSFELVIVSPYPLPDELQEFSNIKLIRDFGNPVRAFNIALDHAEGELITWCSDDGVWQPNVLDKAVAVFAKMPDKKSILCLSCTEGSTVYSEAHCYISAHPQVASPFIPKNYRFTALAIIENEEFRKLGGLNCAFQHHAMSHLDFSIRAQNEGYRMDFLHDIALVCGHMPGRSGDHAPIHDAQMEHDEPLFRKMYWQANGATDKPQIDDWKKVPAIWTRRFS